MKIEIVYPGKIKNAFAKAGFDEYVKRCKRLFGLKVTELRSTKGGNGRRVLKEESKRLEEYLALRKYVLLDVGGEEKTTRQFFEMVKSHLDMGKDLLFVIGGVYGVSEEVKEKAEMRISLSRLTFTHSIALLILSEQIYRALKIYFGQSYDR